ncbi:MAG TPA: methyltransferase domain-containing protein [Acidimicrobiales bacterium]
MPSSTWSLADRSRARYSHHSRYELVAELLRGTEGELLDVGARDRVLESHIDTGSLRYHSADMSEGHDYFVDLEKPLPIPDKSFDTVVCLDVLEHVEHIHDAFAELARISRDRIVISLPNIAVLRTRFRFLFKGVLGGKYSFAPEHQGDRHRWITTHRSIGEFVVGMSERCGVRAEQEVNELMHAHRYLRGLSLVAVRAGVGRRSGILSERSIVVFRHAAG